MHKTGAPHIANKKCSVVSCKQLLPLPLLPLLQNYHKKKKLHADMQWLHLLCSRTALSGSGGHIVWVGARCPFGAHCPCRSDSAHCPCSASAWANGKWAEEGEVFLRGFWG